MHVCAEVKTTRAALTPLSNIAGQSSYVNPPRSKSATHSRRSDPGLYSGLETLRSYNATSPVGSASNSSVNSRQGPSDAVASGLSYLRSTTDQPMQTFGKLRISTGC